MAKEMKKGLINETEEEPEKSRLVLLLGSVFVVLAIAGLVFVALFIATSQDKFHGHDDPKSCPVQQQPCL